MLHRHCPVVVGAARTAADPPARHVRARPRMRMLGIGAVVIATVLPILLFAGGVCADQTTTAHAEYGVGTAVAREGMEEDRHGALRPVVSPRAQSAAAADATTATAARPSSTRGAAAVLSPGQRRRLQDDYADDGGGGGGGEDDGGDDPGGDDPGGDDPGGDDPGGDDPGGDDEGGNGGNAGGDTGEGMGDGGIDGMGDGGDGGTGGAGDGGDGSGSEGGGGGTGDGPNPAPSPVTPASAPTPGTPPSAPTPADTGDSDGGGTGQDPAPAPAPAPSPVATAGESGLSGDAPPPGKETGPESTPAPTKRPSRTPKPHMARPETPKPQYTPPADDKIVGETDDKAVQQNWKDKSFVDIAKEEADAIVHDRNVAIVSSVFGALGFLLLLFTAQQMIENPDGFCGKICRCCIGTYRVLLWPCRKVCGCTPKRRGTHSAIARGGDDDGYGGYAHDLELT